MMMLNLSDVTFECCNDKSRSRDGDSWRRGDLVVADVCQASAAWAEILFQVIYTARDQILLSLCQVASSSGLKGQG